MTNETLIVSMTSYPARIKHAVTAYKSILNQNVDKELYHAVLVLAEPEFPHKEKDLPKELIELCKSDIELIWYPTNIRSHKKLIPTLKKYPNNPILICDDDIIREDGWLQMFIDDHEKYPNDIICGYAINAINPNYKMYRPKLNNNICSVVYNFLRPANGLGGTLYPAHTFEMKEFFDEDLFMQLSPTSDESWQYCFNIMEGRTIRHCSKIFDYKSHFIEDTQTMTTALCRVNAGNKYEAIFNALYERFPQFKEKLSESMRKVIVSFTSHHERLAHLDNVLNSLKSQTMAPSKVVLTVFEEDIPNIPDIAKKLQKEGFLDIIIAEENLKPHLKYFYAMKKYKDYAVITVDDDCTLPSDLVESLYKSYILHPTCVSARRCHLIKYNLNGIPSSYKLWPKQYKQLTTPSFDLFATGVGGVLYPPDILNISDDNIPLIKKCLTADDIYLKYLENIKNIPIVYVPNTKNDPSMRNDLYDKTALWASNVVGNRNDEYMKSFILTKDHKKTKYMEPLNDISDIPNDKRKVIYTCITGGYDNVFEPSNISDDFDYICFTDDNTMKSKVWKFVSIPEELKDLSLVKQQRAIKINPHKYLPQYDLSIWVDGNIKIIGNMNRYIDLHCKSGNVFIPRHPVRQCIYEEVDACRRYKKDTMENMAPQIERYKKEGFPRNFGLVQSNIIVRRHNAEDCIRLMDAWWEELKNGSHRDQLSFNYVLWKNKDVKIKLLDRYVYKSVYFKLFTHKHKK